MTYDKRPESVAVDRGCRGDCSLHAWPNCTRSPRQVGTPNYSRTTTSMHIQVHWLGSKFLHDKMRKRQMS
jgi:hypothetical protein